MGNPKRPLNLTIPQISTKRNVSELQNFFTNIEIKAVKIK